MKLTNRIISAAAAAVVLAGAVTTAQADELSSRYRFDEKHDVIQLADVNLSNPADAQTVMSQVRNTAQNVCERGARPTRLTQGRDRARCIEATYASTVATINAQFDVDLETVAAHAKPMPELASAGK